MPYILINYKKMEKIILFLELLVCFAVICRAQDYTDDPCEEQNHLDVYNELWRNIHSPRVSDVSRCDRYLDEVWYRFYTGGDDSLAQEPVDPESCGVYFPLWVTEPLPTSSAEGIKDMTVCMSSYFENCSETWSIKAKNCDGYHVYLLKATSGCDMAYCVGLDPIPSTIASTTSTALPTTTVTGDPCLEENHVDVYNEEWRNMYNPIVPEASKCDRYIDELWYRFHMTDDKMPSFPVSPRMCGTYFPIWAKDLLPTHTYHGIRDVTVCVSSYFETCEESWSIQVKKCSDYYVYKLKATPGCDMAYCIGTEDVSDSIETTTRTTVDPEDDDSDDDSDVMEQLGRCEDQKQAASNSAHTWKQVAIALMILLAASVAVNLLLFIKRLRGNHSKDGSIPPKPDKLEREVNYWSNAPLPPISSAPREDTLHK